eukprot:CAMPEP_0198288142 /NCGR_PEP_ID=MMETSP1449-20131203/6757_1 /TAXON_ID=420275 /ORGANISM="Attheya septentrionalis, Strain CCMP2084" /LENGTH=394 /DNA_ID=CAMNT_0043986253 /DNA_START=50 /DNA_END=1234 /DNA_ORIENTATION=+
MNKPIFCRTSVWWLLSLLFGFGAALAVSSTPDAAANANVHISPMELEYTAEAEVRQLQTETCTPLTSNFNIQLVNMGTVTVDNDTDDNDSRYDAAFDDAARRWEKVVIGDLPDSPAGAVDDWFQGSFSRPFNGAIDDLLIGYEITAMDGPGGQLGGAGPLFVRRDPRTGASRSTLSGVMFFDRVDFDLMPIEDVKLVILHEMGHVLGLVGTTTDVCRAACNEQNPAEQSVYQCALAAEQYETLVTKVPELAGNNLVLENNGGPGTACGHWDEDVFGTVESSEIMTGFFEADLFQPLSAVTVAGLEDLGYQVDYCGADIWPATNETTQRWEVIRGSSEISPNVLTMMENVNPMWGVDTDGEITTWAPMDVDASSAVHHMMGGVVALLFVIPGLLL